MDHQTLIGYIDRVISNIQSDYNFIKEFSERVKKVDEFHHIDWTLAHLNTSVLELMRDLERLQKYLTKDSQFNADQ